MEQTPQVEKGPERIPTKSEVMEIINSKVESPEKNTVLRELSDEFGLKLLDIRFEGEKSGETVEYVYYRKGLMPNGVPKSETSIEVSFYQNGEIFFGEQVAVFDEQTGEWKE